MRARFYLGTQLLADVELELVQEGGSRAPRPVKLSDEISVAVIDERTPREPPLFITGRLERA